MKITEIETIALRIPYENRIRKRYYHFAMTEEVTVYKFQLILALLAWGKILETPSIKSYWMPISVPIHSIM